MPEALYGILQGYEPTRWKEKEMGKLMRVSPSYGYYSTDQASLTTTNKVVEWLQVLWLKLQGYKEVKHFTEKDRTIQLRSNRCRKY